MERCHGALEKKRAGWEKKGCGAFACFYRETKKGRKLVALLLLGRRLVGLTLHVYSGCLPPLAAARCALQKKKVGGGTEKERDVDPEMNFPLVPPLSRRRRRSESSTLSRGFCFKAIVCAIALSFSICSSSQGVALPRALAKSQVKLHTFLH